MRTQAGRDDDTANKRKNRPNYLFRQARERLRTPSGTVPSRREIADLVNVYLAEKDPSEHFIERNLQSCSSATGDVEVAPLAG